MTQENNNERYIETLHVLGLLYVIGDLVKQH